MDERLHHLESRTMSIDENIASMMAFWKIAQAHKRKAISDPQDNTSQPMITKEPDGALQTADLQHQNDGVNSSC
jgi:hypothetical protein